MLLFLCGALVGAVVGLAIAALIRANDYDDVTRGRPA